MSRYICDDCGSIFYDPDTKEMYGELHDCCPMCNSVNVHKDWSYIEREEALQKAYLQLDELKERFTDLQVHINHRLNNLEAEMTFSVLIDEIDHLKNQVVCLKDYLKGYEQ